MAMLGLLNTEQFASERFKNYRRSVFYKYPNGAAPLTGLTSMLSEETTDDPEYRWFEDRWDPLRSTLAYTTGTIAFFSGTSGANLTISAGPDGSAIGGTWTYANAAANITLAVPTTAINNRWGIKVADSSQFRVNHVIKFPVILAAGGTFEVKAVIENIDRTNHRLGIRSLTATGAIDHDGAHLGLEVLVIGSAVSEGSLNTSEGIYIKPTEQFNYTQIFRTPYSWTGTQGKTSVKWDQEGTHPDLAKKHAIFHMVELEKAFMFGERSQLAISGRLPVRTTGGLLFFLRQWELGTVYGNSASAITTDTDDQKRIITNASGKLSERWYDTLLERAFRVTNNSSNEKLVFCGNGALMTLNQLYRSKSVLNTNIPMEDTYGMDVVSHKTPFGTVHYKTHPLFNANPILRNCMLVIDVNHLKYRYLDGRDTKLRPEIHANDADHRTDEWLTECGMEYNLPESGMFISNVLDYEV